jgi:hypothetical protein
MPEGVHSADQRETDQLATHQAEISWKHVSRYPKKKISNYFVHNRLF